MVEEEKPEPERKQLWFNPKTHRPIGGPYLIPKDPPGTPAKRFQTGREEATIRRYVEAQKTGENLTLSQCAVESGYAKSSSSSVAKRITEKIENSTILQRKMEEWGVGIDALARDIASISEATLPRRMCRYCSGVGKMDPDKDTGEREECHHCNGVGYFDDPDNFIRHKNVELRAKLFDAMPSTKIDVTEKVLNIHLSLDRIEKLGETMRDLGDD